VLALPGYVRQPHYLIWIKIQKNILSIQYFHMFKVLNKNTLKYNCEKGKDVDKGLFNVGLWESFQLQKM